MADNSIPTFNNKDQLLNIRTKSLNPAIVKVNALELNQQTLRNNVNEVAQKAAAMELTITAQATSIKNIADGLKTTFTDCRVLGEEKIIQYYHKETGTYLGSCNLTPMFTDEGLSIASPTTVSKTVKKLYFQGTGVNLSIDPKDTSKGIVTINQGGGGGGGSIDASIHGGASKAINSINITGPTPGTEINGTQLNLHLPDGRFEGFYDTITSLNLMKDSAEPNQSYAYLKVASGSGSGWMPMKLVKEPGLDAVWNPIYAVGALQVMSRDANGNYTKEGFSNTIVHSGNIKVVDGNIFIHDDSVTGSFVENDDPTFSRIEAKPPVDQGMVGHYQFLGPKGSVKHESIPGSDKHKVVVDLNKGSSLEGVVKKGASIPSTGPFTKLEVSGNVGSSTIVDGVFKVELPKQTASVVKDGQAVVYNKIMKTKVTGNVGLSQVDTTNNVLTVDLPFVKVGKKDDKVFENTHRSYKWDEPFTKWDDDFQWNPIKEGFERRWEDDESWEDGNHWGVFSDSEMSSVTGIKFDGNVEFAPPAEGETEATVKIPYLKGTEIVQSGTKDFDIKQIKFPGTAKVVEGVVDLTDAISGKISGYVRKEGDKSRTEEAIDGVSLYGPFASINNVTVGDVTTKELTLDTRPYSRISITSPGVKTSVVDAMEVRGSIDDLTAFTETYTDEGGTQRMKDVVSLSGFERLPKQFPSTGTADFSIDNPSNQTRFVFVAPGTKTDNGGVNYKYKEPTVKWNDQKHWNTLGADSPSKDLALKGGWVMNLFTNAASEELGNMVTQVFYPVDASGVRVRTGSTSTIGKKAWDNMGSAFAKIGEDERFLNTLDVANGIAEWGTGGESRTLKLKDTRTSYSRRTGDTEAYEWNLPTTNIKFTDPGNNVTKDDDAIHIKIPDAQAELAGVEKKLGDLIGMLPPVSGFVPSEAVDPDTYGGKQGWGYVKPDDTKKEPLKSGGVFTSYYVQASIDDTHPHHVYTQILYQSVGHIWYRSVTAKDITNVPWTRVAGGLVGTWKNDDEGQPELHTMSSIKFEGIDDTDWNPATFQLTVPIADKGIVDRLDKRYPEKYDQGGSSDFNINKPGDVNGVYCLDKTEAASLPETMVNGGIVSTFFREGVDDTNKAQYSQTYLANDGGGLYFRSGNLDGDDPSLTDVKWVRAHERPKAVFVGTVSSWFWELFYSSPPTFNSTKNAWVAPTDIIQENERGCFKIKPVHDNLAEFVCREETTGSGNRHYVQIPYTGNFDIKWGINLGYGAFTNDAISYDTILKVVISVYKTLESGAEELLVEKKYSKGHAGSVHYKFLTSRQTLFLSQQFKLNKGDKLSFVVRFLGNHDVDIVPPPVLNGVNDLSSVWLNDRFGQFKNFLVIEDSQSEGDIGLNLATSFRTLWGGSDNPPGLDTIGGHVSSSNRYASIVRTFDQRLVNI